ncbi:MAG: cupredoxin domain-containing protein [Acidobacteriota bacterium]
MSLQKTTGLLTAASLAICLSLFAACGSPQGDGATEASSKPADQGGGQRVEISASKYEFKPRELKLKAGQPIRVVLTSTGGTHSFHVDALNVHSAEAGEGKTISLEFTADRPGTYEFYCAHGDHKDKGMTGRLEITP